MRQQQLMKVAFASIIALGVAMHGSRATASDNPTKDQAVAMVKKGITFIKANGVETGYAAITDKKGQFQDRDLYLVVYGLDGKCRAHGANEKQVGRDLIDMKEIDGKPFIKERVDLAKVKGTFWQDYKFTNAVTKKIEPKQMYCEKLNETIVCGGVYK